jgi:polyribonucleotide nucleotidyltransferase
MGQTEIRGKMKVTHEFDLYGKHYTLETGELAKQATGSCLVKAGDSTVLLTAVVSKERKDYDFFPLTVDFIEKMYAVGRIPGGYLKREARPSEKATLTARMIDRPLRPSFPDGFRNEVQIVATTLVADQINPVDTICVMAASAALTVGGVPFEGPLACVRIGRNTETGEWLVNPTYEERKTSDLDLELGGSRHVHLHARGWRPGDLRGRHARSHGIRPGGHRCLLRAREDLLPEGPGGQRPVPEA